MGYVEERAAIVADGSLRGRDLTSRLAQEADRWLGSIFDETAAGVEGRLALVATGGYGRGRLAPHSDLDVLLLHEDVDGIAELADGFWYPIWDAGLRLGHAVRTVPECLAVSANDLETASAILGSRCVAGDRSLVDELVDDIEVLWAESAGRLLGELVEDVEGRSETFGEVAFLLEPDLKSGGGGLRDVDAIRWVDLVWPMHSDADRQALRDAEDTLLAARVELHRMTGRADDRLLLERQDAVGEALGVDADELMGMVASAAKAVTWIGDETWRIVRRKNRGTDLAVDRDRPLAPGVIRRDGTVHVVADPAADPAVSLRAAAAAARSDSPIDRASLAVLADRLPVYDEPWPGDARERLIDLLGQGRPAIGVLESLDQAGLLSRLLPEWEPVRSRPQRNAYHRYTVDRHLHEAAAEASRLTDRVRRADLLLVAAWLHDLGKGYPGDHTVVGMELIASIGRRMGFPPADIETLVSLVEHHLLLPDVATRRDLADDATLRRVADLVGDTQTLELLGALTEADSIATGPSAWGSWKASLVHTLVERVMQRLGGEDLDIGSILTDEHRRLLAERGLTVQGRGDLLTVVNTDRAGGFSRIAGALALRGLDVLEANAHSEDGIAVSVFKVVRSTGEPPQWTGVIEDVEAALRGRLALEARVRERERLYAPRKPVAPTPARTTISVTNDESDTSTIVEVRTGDRLGVLYHVTRALAELDLDIRHAKVQTLGHEVVDSFYVADASGAQLDDAYADEVVLSVRHVLTAA
ncbi:MAG: [protein-PII] uridylyltransferase [Actinomycetota bacterium]